MCGTCSGRRQSGGFAFDQQTDLPEVIDLDAGELRYANRSIGPQLERVLRGKPADRLANWHDAGTQPVGQSAERKRGGRQEFPTHKRCAQFAISPAGNGFDAGVLVGGDHGLDFVMLQNRLFLANHSCSSHSMARTSISILAINMKSALWR